MNKINIIDQLITQLNDELTIALGAVEQAHQAAIDEQSIAETQYDTLAIEAGYLAHGQAKRVTGIQTAITQLNTLRLSAEQNNTHITLGSVIYLAMINDDSQQVFFLAPCAGGYHCQLVEQQQTVKITVITPESPMGKALKGLTTDDEINLTIANKTLETEIINTY